jgi:predicted nucleic acid-binding protein
MTSQINEARALLALRHLDTWAVSRLPLLPLVKIAWQYRHNVSAYDAFYVAAAVDREARVITTDGRLSRAPGLGIDVIHIQLP